MIKKLMIASLVTAAIGISTVPALAAEASLDVDVMSSYVWRGQVLNKEGVVQPSLSASTEYGLGFNAWGNMDITDDAGNKSKFTEIDLTASYAPPVDGPIGVEIGLIEYTFPNSSASSTREAYAAAEADVVGTPAVAFYYDFGEVNSMYMVFGLSEEFLFVEEKLALGIGASLGLGGNHYNKMYFGGGAADEDELDEIDKVKFNDLNIGADISYDILENLSVGASASYMYLVDSTIRDAADEAYGKKDRFFGGVSAGYTF